MREEPSRLLPEKRYVCRCSVAVSPRLTFEAFLPAKVAAILEHVRCFLMQRPIGTFARSTKKDCDDEQPGKEECLTDRGFAVL